MKDFANFLEGFGSYHETEKKKKKKIKYDPKKGWVVFKAKR